MPRWEPGAQERLAAAALELFERDGYAQTTVDDIAARAGVTTRTFFRYFPDKREALFGGAGAFEQRFVDGLREADEAASTWDGIAAAVHSAAGALEGRRAHAARRHRVIAANLELRERELVKMESVAAAVTEALLLRGVAEATARIAGRTTVTVFLTAFDRWVSGAHERDLSPLLDEALLAVAQLAPAPRTERPARRGRAAH